MNATAFACCLLLGLMTLTSCTSVEPVKGVNPTRLGFALGYDDTETEYKYDGQPTVKEETTTYYGNVDGGYRVTPNLELGGMFGYQSEDSKLTGALSGDSEFELVNIGPKVRFYMVSEGNVQPWISASAGWSYFDSKFDNGVLSGDQSDDGYFFEGGVGISYFPSRWIALEAALMYQQLNLNVDGSDSTGNFRGDVDTNSTFLMVGLSTFF